MAGRESDAAGLYESV